MDCSACLSCGMVVLLIIAGCLFRSRARWRSGRRTTTNDHERQCTTPNFFWVRVKGAVLFIFYLAKSLTPNRECIEHNYASAEQCGNILPEECKDHDYFRKTETKTISKLIRNMQMI